jgi:hypothetical protein
MRLISLEIPLNIGHCQPDEHVSCLSITVYRRFVRVACGLRPALWRPLQYIAIAACYAIEFYFRPALGFFSLLPTRQYSLWFLPPTT